MDDHWLMDLGAAMGILLQLGLAGGIIAAVVVLLREIRAAEPSLFAKVDAIDQRVDAIAQDVAHIRGRLDGDAERSGRHPQDQKT